MPVYRLQVGWQVDSAFPRDEMIVTPHFNSGSVIQDADALCEDLADALSAWGGLLAEINVTAYDAQGTPPVFPVGHAVRHQGEATASVDPRELALCLSFYSGQNAPRNRGRLYIPAVIAARGATGRVRPAAAAIQKVADLAPIFADLGGADVDWCVFSRRDNAPRSVSHWWVDDEWDIIRSRGLRGETRLSGTTSEA